MSLIDLARKAAKQIASASSTITDELGKLRARLTTVVALLLQAETWLLPKADIIAIRAPRSVEQSAQEW